MPARKIIARIIRVTGIALGLGALTLFAHLMWPVIAMDPNGRNAVRDVMVIVFGGFGVLALIAWPFALVADYIDSSLRTTEATTTPKALTSAPHSRPARSTASKPAKPR